MQGHLRQGLNLNSNPSHGEGAMTRSSRPMVQGSTNVTFTGGGGWGVHLICPGPYYLMTGSMPAAVTYLYDVR
ncbi:hypothetical protein CY34DRAFT_812384 [Suillus luteus UH-Slu-Lm8-n1]|uniref:Uncharacterized protein n=1 Tax=Suillus luteus UH-Slu-Lm8-n1 TaxID=930992 RepID=A0A0D0A030_9AGAM|nr:hypothetical protein CY34DRAFT_812384 [Suillus luteus UH-Slu-Lm8-n1]